MTGERYVPGFLGPIQLEHYHRYLFALKFAENRDVIDVASGEGYGSALLAQVSRSVTGVDVDSEAIQNSKRRYESQKVSFHIGNAINVPCESDSFDLAVSFETIEHLEEHSLFLAELKRVLRPDGILVISTPDRPYYQATLAEPNHFHLNELDWQEFEGLLGGHFRHVKIFEQRSLHGSVIVSTDTSQDMSELEFFHSKNGSDFRRIEKRMSSPFLVAVASDAQLPPCGASIMDSPAEIEKLRGDLGYASGEMWRLQARVSELESQALEASNRIEQLAGELQKAKTIAELAKAEVRYLRTR